MNNLYIPKELHIGFQDRSDTYTNRLGYVIYKDGKGKLRKETSWNSWRDHKIEPIISENKPSRFIINKQIRRIADWFGTDKEKIRIFDHRDFEFEISVQNLLQILNHSDITKRDIVQECVYAWQGTELVLLPTNSEEYKSSVEYTAGMNTKFSAKSLVIGRTYKHKTEEGQFLYLGYFKTYIEEPIYLLDGVEIDQDTARNIRYGYASDGVKMKVGSQLEIGNTFKEKKARHIFMQIGVKNMWYALEPTAKLVGETSSEIHPEFAEYHEQYFKLIGSKPVAGFKVVNRGFPASSYYATMYKEVNDKIFSISYSQHCNEKNIRIDVYLKKLGAHPILIANPEICNNTYRYGGYQRLNIDESYHKEKDYIQTKQEAVDVIRTSRTINDYLDVDSMTKKLSELGWGSVVLEFNDGTLSDNIYKG